MRVATPAVVDQRPHSRDSDRYFRQAFPPRTPKTVADDHRDLDPKLFLQLAPQLPCGTIRILRQQHSVLSAIHVRYIHAAVRANEAVFRLRDQHTTLSPHDSTTLTHRQFTDACVEPVASSPFPRSRRRPDLIQCD